MQENRLGLRVIDGLRRTSSGSQRVHAPPATRGPGSPPGACVAAGNLRGDLNVALRVMEDRLTTLIDDREHLARELHDCVLQALYAIGLNLEASRRMIPSSTPDLHRFSSNVVAQLNRLIQEVRGMIRSLESGTVQEFDLQAELRALAATYADAGHLRITTNISPDVVALLTHEEQREVLKILREAVSNSARHANAANVAISLHARGSTVRLHVCDDGIGFKNDESHPRGYGIANMAARAKKLGGRLRIRSRIGRGTRVVVEFALEPALPNS